MPDVLIRDLPAEDLVLLDEQARRLGLSRAEYLRRQLRQAARRTVAPEVTRADLVHFSELVVDLEDGDTMSGAWS